MAKKLFIKTYGCQMNVYDSARMTDVLGPIGYETTDRPDNADMVILNTCHIREKASEKVYSELGRLRLIKDERALEDKRTLIAVAGCVAQAEGAEILKRAPQVDIVLGPQTYHRLPEMIARAERENGGVLDTDFPADAKFDHLPDPHADGISAFLSVQEGCDKFCTYCVVPYTRGAEFSRPVDAILAEAKALLAGGVREITLIGQNVNAFHGEGPDGKAWGLGRLIYELAEIDGLARLRYTTSHPMDMADDLFDAHRDVPALMPFVHLPVQSGSDTILKAMNRSHSADDYKRVVERLKGTRDDLALSSDFIVGFPGETDKDFRATMDLIEDIGFIQAFSFMYSPRPGTPAAVMPAQIEDAVKAERLQALQALLMSQQIAFNKSCEGRVLPILFDRPGRYDDQLGGRSPYMQPVHAAIPPDAYGQVIDCRVVKGSPNSLTAEPVARERAIA